MAKTNSSDPNEVVAGLVFVGCLLIGTAVGFALSQLIVGAVVGLGVGFIGLALVLKGKK